MRRDFQVRWLSKERRNALIRAGRLGRALLLDTFNGFIIVEPAGSDLGDGRVLSPEEADYELRPVWCLSPHARLKEARRRLGLETETMTGQVLGAAV